MRRALLTLFLLLAPAAPAAARWGEVDRAGLGRARPASCLRDAGGGQLALLAQQGGRYGAALYTASADALVPAGRVLLGRALAACPAVAANGSGAAVAAVPVLGRSGRRTRPQRLLAVVRDRPGAFALRTVMASVSPADGAIAPAVAVAGDGRMLVAWQEYLPGSLDGRDRVAVRAALRAPGGAFGPAQTLMDAAGEQAPDVTPAAGFDAAGAATVAWARPLPARRRGTIAGLAAVEAATAPPGGTFGAPAVVTREAQDVATIALAVAPDGRALVAHDGDERVRVLERGPGEPGFSRRAVAGGDAAGALELPAVALAPDGGAVVAWRAAGGTAAMARAGAGAFAPAATLARPDPGFGDGGWTGYAASGGPPAETDDGRLRVAAAAGGRAAVGWLAPAGRSGAPASLRVATAAGGRFAPPVTLGGPVRDAAVAVPRLDHGVPTTAWTDNGVAARRPDGRLHLAGASAPRARPAPPRVTATARPQALFHREPLAVTAHCAAACDVRATIAPRPAASVQEEPALPAVGTAGRDDAGPLRIRVAPAFLNHIAPRGAGGSASWCEWRRRTARTRRARCCGCGSAAARCRRSAGRSACARGARATRSS